MVINFYRLDFWRSDSNGFKSFSFTIPFSFKFADSLGRFILHHLKFQSRSVTHCLFVLNLF